MANVLTSEKPIEAIEPPTAPAIREAILAYLPDDPNIQRDIRVHDGICDVMIKWRTLRWSICMGLNGQTPAMIGLSAAEQFRKWLVGTLNNTTETPRHYRVLREMDEWLSQQDGGVWADVERYRTDGNQHAWRVAGEEPQSNKTEIQ